MQREEVCECRNHAAKGGAISYPDRGCVAEAGMRCESNRENPHERVPCPANAPRKLRRQEERGAEERHRPFLPERTGAAAQGKRPDRTESPFIKEDPAVKRINYMPLQRERERERESSGRNGVIGTGGASPADAHVTWSAERSRQPPNRGLAETRGNDTVVVARRGAVAAATESEGGRDQ